MRTKKITISMDERTKKCFFALSKRMSLSYGDVFSFLVVQCLHDTRDEILDEELRRDIEIKRTYKKLIENMRINQCFLSSTRSMEKYIWSSFCAFGEVDIDYLEKYMIDCIEYQDSLNINRIHSANLLDHNFRSLSDRKKLEMFVSSTIKRMKEENDKNDMFYKRRKK